MGNGVGGFTRVYGIIKDKYVIKLQNSWGNSDHMHQYLNKAPHQIIINWVRIPGRGHNQMHFTTVMKYQNIYIFLYGTNNKITQYVYVHVYRKLIKSNFFGI